jgi:hypothetical protein
VGKTLPLIFDQSLNLANPLKSTPALPISPHMVNSISSAYTSQATAAAQQATAPKLQTQQSQKSSPQPSDTVTLKSTGDLDHDGDSH